MTSAVSVIAIEGKGPNALTVEAIAALSSALDEAEADPAVEAILLKGKPGGAFCVGLDNAVLADGEAAAADLLNAMGHLLLRLFTSHLRIVAQVEGHAVAAGAMLLLVSDLRIGTPGNYRVGFSEVGIGMPLPGLPLALARHRLTPTWLTRTTALADLLPPDDAQAAGFLDHVTDNVDAAALQGAERLAALPRTAYTQTAATLRAAAVQEMKLSLGVR
ncbi:enoyl-CoA hydratase-related protein [Pyruvatibacter sp.]|uniref:enoyl-CoA hydratase-related protein n=1 Tax=Pyruvatibacter sp. TaxID=1981328 RepID=UPI0032EC22F9